jgi:hypothetical protein
MKADKTIAIISAIFCLFCLGCALFAKGAEHHYGTAFIVGIFSFANYLEYRRKKNYKEFIKNRKERS